MPSLRSAPRSTASGSAYTPTTPRGSSQANPTCSTGRRDNSRTSAPCLLAAETAADARTGWRVAGDTRRETAARNYALALAERCENAQTPALRGLGRREELSGTELATAWAAARGESNKAIAARLQLSVRTVETRLQGVYQKLGVSGRKDLAAALPQEATASPADLAP